MTSLSQLSNSFINRAYPQQIDDVAHVSPLRTFALVPQINWLEDGWQAANFQQVSRAIDFLSWWLDAELGKSLDFEGIAYIGVHDLRFALILGSAAKTRRRILLPDSTLSPAVLCSLLDRINCQTIICSQEVIGTAEKLQQERLGLQLKVIPSLSELLALGSGPRHYPFEFAFDQIKKDPFLICHTSGTTGQPKPLGFTHEVLRKCLAPGWNAMAEGYDTAFIRARGKKVLVTAPLNWVASIFFSSMAVAPFDVIPVLPPTDLPRPLTAAGVAQILDRVEIHGAMLSTVILKEIAKKQDMLNRLDKLELVWFSGAKLDKWAGDLISEHCFPVNLIGATEVGPFHVYASPRELWQYHRIIPGLGFRMDALEGGLYETVIDRDDALSDYQPVFDLFPDLQQYRTKDVWEPHPDFPEYFLHAGRVDDLIKTAAQDKINTSHIESLLEKLPHIRSALVGGNGKPFPFALAELYDDNQEATGNKAPNTRSEEDTRTAIWNEIWAEINEINNDPTKMIYIPKPLVLLADPETPLPKTSKDTINRREALVLYESKIEAAYAAVDKEKVRAQMNGSHVVVI